MRIVVASDHLPPHRSGHAVAAAWWTRALADAGHELFVVADAPDLRLPGVRWRRLPVVPGFSDGHPLAAFRPPGRALDDLAAHPPDVVHLHGYGPACRTVASALPGVPVLLTLHQFPDGSGTPAAAIVVPIMRRLLRSTAARAAHVTVPSERARERLAGELGHDVAARASVVPVGIDPAFRPVAADRRVAVGDASRPTIVFVGRRTPDKGFDRFERLARRHPEADWHAIGAGPTRPDAPYRVTEHLDARGVADALHRADVLFAPGPFETQGIAVLEALACGTAVAVPGGSAQAEPLVDGMHGASYRADVGTPSEIDASAWRAIERAVEATRAGSVTMPERYDRASLTRRMTSALRRAAER